LLTKGMKHACYKGMSRLVTRLRGRVSATDLGGEHEEDETHLA